MSKVVKDKIVYFMFRIKYDGNDYKTISILQKINKNKSTLNELLKFYIGTLNYKNEQYYTTKIEKIIFTYKIIPDEKLESKETRIGPSKKYIPSDKAFNFLGYNLPNTMDVTKLGDIIYIEGNIILVQNQDRLYRINKLEKYNFFQLNIKNKLVLEYKDYLNDVNNLDTFTRYIKDQEYKFINGKLIVKLINRKTKFIKSIKPNKIITNKFITLDIETRVINNIILPYLISYYDGVQPTSFYLSDYLDERDMLRTCILSLFQEKYKNHIIYVHNLSFFDGIFLMKIFASIENILIIPIMKDGKLFNIELTYNDIRINFRDSFLM